MIQTGADRCFAVGRVLACVWMRLRVVVEESSSGDTGKDFLLKSG